MWAQVPKVRVAPEANEVQIHKIKNSRYLDRLMVLLQSVKITRLQGCILGLGVSVLREFRDL